MDIMIDIETLATNDNACIVSIGAVAFTDKERIEYYNNISINSNIAINRNIDGNTLKFWFDQDKETQQALFDPEPINLDKALIALNSFIGIHLGKKRSIWANGVSFDLNILKSAFINFNMLPAWQFRQECCLRSIKRVSKRVGITYGDYKGSDKYQLHNALSDCHMQIDYLQDFMNKLRA